MSDLKKWATISSAAIAALAAAHAPAAATIYGAPGYTTASGGYRGSTSSIPSNPGLSVASTGSDGLTIANEGYYPGASNTGANSSPPPILIDPLAPGGYTFLGTVAGQTSGYTAVSLNPNASLIVGTATVQTTPSASTGAVVWTSSGTPYILPLPTYVSGLPSSAVANATGRGINNSGTVVGGGNFYTAAGIQSASSGFAYYNAGTTAAPSYSSGTAVQLLPLGLSNANPTNNQSVIVTGISTAGVAAGSSSQSAGNTYASFWNVGNTPTGATTLAANQLTVTAPTGFSTLKADNATGANSSISVISPSGVAAGSAILYPSGSSSGNYQAVRWTPASGQSLSTSTPGVVLSRPAGYTTSTATAINNNGDAVGTASGATINTVSVQSAILWKAGTTAATQLQAVANPVVNPGTGSSAIPAVPSYTAKGINDSGYSVGFATSSSGSTTPIDAVLWDPNGNATELNSLTTLVAAGGTSAGWVTLVGAYSITNDNWVSGLGVYYDPAVVTYSTTGNPAPQQTYGAGTYYRAFEIQVPEPASLAVLSLGAVALLRRRRMAMQH